MAFFHFLKYNNAVPIAISLMLLGAGGVFAATDPGAVYSSSEQVVSVDNTYLVNKDLSTFTPKILITAVTEDTENYYVAYSLYSIDLKDAVWQDITRDETMEVSKADLGPYRDLGVYVAQKMKDITSRESQRLTDTQADARTHVSQKVVATEYGGLIGKFLDPTTEQLPGYTPVVQPKAQVAAAVETTPSDSAPAPEPSVPQNTQSGPGPVLQVLGNNPVRIPLKTSYVDLGAIIVLPVNSNLGVHVFMDGREIPEVMLDTSAVGDWTITYKVTDQDGNVGTATRTVHVFDPAAPQEATSTVSTISSGTPATSTPASAATSTSQ